MKLTKRGERVFAFFFVGVLVIVMGFVGWLENLPASAKAATDAECDAIYHAVWVLEGNPARVDLIHKAFDLGCPFEDGDGDYIYTWEGN